MKLVKDKVPEIMRAEGKTPKTHIAAVEEYKEYLLKKLEEEVAEVKRDLNEEELADVIEVVYALTELLKKSPADLENTRLRKLEKTGGFKKRIILENA